jgi:predicted naringenin-chalcone synthase/protein-S-isoprenylcysteine O-methyltransferase Ste14
MASDTDQAARIVTRYTRRLGLKPETYLRILRNIRIESRYAVLSEDQVDAPMPLKQRNDLYIEQCLQLGERVARDAIARAGLMPADIDSIISVSCTGYMIPAMDAHLLNHMGLSTNIRRTPLTELGCIAGAVGLARAWEELQVYPDSNVLLLSVELPSLTFQPNDPRPTQVISSMLFTDGAAAVVLSGRSNRPSPRLLGRRMYTMSDTLGEMGYNLDDDGLHIVLSPAVPHLIQRTLVPQVDALLARHGLARGGPEVVRRPGASLPRRSGEQGPAPSGDLLTRRLDRGPRVPTVADWCLRCLPLAFGVVFIGGLVGWRCLRFHRLYGHSPIHFPGCRGRPRAQAFLSRVLAAFFGAILALGVLAAFWPAGLEAVDLLYGPPGLVLLIPGMALAALAAALVWRGQEDMAASWRIGMDPGERTELVTGGLFRFCRNPIYLGLQLALAAFCCLLPGYLSLGLLVLGAVLLHVQARLEEGYLLERHGPDYAEYCARVGRFLPFTGRWPAPAASPRQEPDGHTD